jgi:hypothetical protein
LNFEFLAGSQISKLLLQVKWDTITFNKSLGEILSNHIILTSFCIVMQSKFQRKMMTECCDDRALEHMQIVSLYTMTKKKKKVPAFHITICEWWWSLVIPVFFDGLINLRLCADLTTDIFRSQCSLGHLSFSSSLEALFGFFELRRMSITT